MIENRVIDGFKKIIKVLEQVLEQTKNWNLALHSEALVKKQKNTGNTVFISISGAPAKSRCDRI